MSSSHARNHARRTPTAAAHTSGVLAVARFGVYVGLLCSPLAAQAQGFEGMLSGTGRESSAGEAAPNITAGLPGGTEVIQAERPVINPLPLPSLAIEEPVDPNAYICGRGDVLELNFWGRQNFKLRLAVDLEGRTFISKVGYVDIGGKTLTQARAVVRSAVLRYFPGLNFDLGLVEPRTFLVHVVENIPRPGLYAARPVDRVSTVIDRAGGSVDRSATATANVRAVSSMGAASQRRIEIRHRNGTTTQVDLLLYNLTGEARYNPYLLDGDVVRIPFEELAVDITGAVHRPGHYELVGSKDLAELVFLAGGLSSQATRQLPIKLVRRGKDERAVQSDIPFSATADANGLPTVALRADDAVHVPGVAELQRSVTVVGALAGALPGDDNSSVRRMPFVENDTVRSLVERAGGVSSLAALTGGSIVRRDGSSVPVNLEALLVHRDAAADQPIEMGDTLLVPFKRVTVVVGGAVAKPTAILFNPQFTAQNYVAMAGGQTRYARSLDDARLVTPTGETKPYQDALPVGPGDTIIIPERDFSRAEIAQLIVSGVGLAVSALSVAAVVYTIVVR